MFSSTSWKYAAVEDEEKTCSHPPSHNLTRYTTSPIIRTIIAIILTILVFLSGRLSASIPLQQNDTTTSTETSIPITSTSTLFTYNRTFATGDPSATEAWKSLFPKQMGYFSHPNIAPERSTLSVYHQLHCLDGIRQAYWVLHSIASTPGQTLNESKLPMMISPPHVRHCIDLLRQTLMCNADLTVEVKDKEAGGVHGFGVVHQCRNWEGLNRWVEAWENEY